MSDPFISSLFDQEERRPATVSELNAEIRSALEARFPGVWLEGEIMGFHAAASGHWYFSLTDGSSFIKAACFKGRNFRIRFRPEDGLLVRVRGKVTTYEKRGEYQLIVESLEPVGEGALAVAFEQIKERLRVEGLFDEALKRPLPAFPQRVGVVTSPTGAAIHDILTVLKRRARSVSVVVVPTLVQGERAGEQIVSAIRFANEYGRSASEEQKIDVLIVGRGGGSAEDLWAFNEEQVARAIRASKIPVISAVGHEVDFTIADFAADVRAATPSAAAEMVAEREDVLETRIETARRNLVNLLEYRLIRSRERFRKAQGSTVFFEFPQRLRELSSGIRERFRDAVDAVKAKIELSSKTASGLTGRLSPAKLSANVEARRNRLEAVGQRGANAMAKKLAGADERLKVKVASLEALSPLAVLSRGFSLTRDSSGRIVRDSSVLAPGDLVSVLLSIGGFESTVTRVDGEEDRRPPADNVENRG